VEAMVYRLNSSWYNIEGVESAGKIAQQYRRDYAIEFLKKSSPKKW
jgi:hypothetical protein